MSRAPDLTPPIVAGVEQEYVTFDFAAGLVAGATISSIGVVTVYSLSGNDLTPAARILTSPSITVSPSTNVAAQAVFALFGNMVAGLYLLQCVVHTSDGQTLSAEARWFCVNPTP
jgi:hypothetical protein